MEYGLLKNFQVGVLPHGVSPHTHGEFEFHFVARGEGILNWKKERRGVRRGDFFAIPPDEKHFMEQKGGGESMTQIFFTGRFPPEAEDLAVWLTRGRGAGKIFHAGSLRLGFFDQLMRDVGRGGLSARAASFEWLGFLYRLMDASELNAHLADESPVDALLDEMYRSVRRDFDPQSFANKIKIPFAVLARRFQKKNEPHSPSVFFKTAGGGRRYRARFFRSKNS